MTLIKTVGHHRHSRKKREEEVYRNSMR